jgi:hypothetical protein
MTEPSRAPYRCEASGMGFDPTTQTLLASPRVYRLWNHVNPTIHARRGVSLPNKGARLCGTCPTADLPNIFSNDGCYPYGVPATCRP